jgi:hypothetical protein
MTMTVTPIIVAIDRWKAKCLLNDGSIFTTEKIWTSDNLEQLHQHFVSVRTAAWQEKNL